MYLNKLITEVKQRKREKKQLLNLDINGKLMVKFLSYSFAFKVFSVKYSLLKNVLKIFMHEIIFV